MPPPELTVAVFPEILELAMLTVPEALLCMPPPKFPAVFRERVELEMERVPELLKAPPLPEVFAPETVTPEIERLPPEAMLKMLKLRFVLMVPEELSRPLIIREEEPGPVMVRVPTVPPPPEAVTLASKMVGNEALILLWESSVMVPVMLKLMMSSPAVVLARIMAFLKEVTLGSESTVSAVVLTVKVVGVILFSRLRSSSRGSQRLFVFFYFGSC